MVGTGEDGRSVGAFVEALVAKHHRAKAELVRAWDWTDEGHGVSAKTVAMSTRSDAPSV